jgi:hypothetical protein
LFFDFGPDVLVCQGVADFRGVDRSHFQNLSRGCLSGSIPI